MKRLTYKYYLKPSNKLSPKERTTKEPVWVMVSLPSYKVNGQVTPSRQYLNLGVTIKPDYFGSITTRGKGITYTKEIVDSNLNTTSDFRNMRTKFDGVMNSLYNKYEYDQPENHEITDFIIQTFAYDPTKNNRNVVSIHSYIESHVTFLKSIQGTGRSEEVCKNTIRRFPVINNLIDAYDTSTKKKLTFSKLTEEKYYALWEHANDAYKAKTGAPYKPRTLLSYQKALLDICNNATSQGEKLGMENNSKKLLIDLDKVEIDNTKVNLYLTEEKLLEIANHTFDDKAWENTRKYILIAACTGMRSQSMKWCSGQPILKCKKHGYKYIDSEQGKTGTECFIPLTECVKNLCVDDKFPVFKYSGVTYNKTIKKILQYFNTAQFKDFSTHNMRSSLVTNLANNLVDLETIALITHPKKIKTSTSVDIYVRSTKLYRSEIFYLEASLIQGRNNATIFKY